MPIVRLTTLNVRRLPPIGGRLTDYTDALLPGFVLRVTPTGRRSYGIRWAGGRRRLALGNADKVPLGVARERARKALERTANGLDPDSWEPSIGLTVGELVRRCLHDLQLRPSTRREWERLFRAEIEPSLGDRSAGDLRRSDIREWARAIRARSGWTANHAFDVLRRAYSWARREELVESSPCDHLPKPFEGRQSERVLSAEELCALVRCLDRAQLHRPAYADATRLLLLTGVRRASVLGLCRDELEGLEGPDPRWIVPADRSKSGQAHLVPLSPPAVAILRRRLDAVPTRHLFPLRGGTEEPMTWTGRWRTWLRVRVARAVRARRRRAGLAGGGVPRWTIHGLRHTMATHLREDLAVPPDVVSLLLGHTLAGPRASRIYDRAQLLAERRRALEAWAEWLEGLSAPTGAPGRVIAFRR